MSETVPVSVSVDGERHASDVEARPLLVHHLGDELGLTGTHVAATPRTAGRIHEVATGR